MRTAMGWALILATLSSSACHTMKPVALDQLAGIQPNRVWVKRDHQPAVLVSNPKVFGDTLVGFVNRKYAVMPSASADQVLVKTSAPKRTAVLIAAGAVLLGGVAFRIGGSGAPAAPTQSKCDINESGSNVECPQQ
jgi:hypothetical protein